MWATVVSYLTEFEMNCKPFLFLKVSLGFCTGLSTHNIVLCTWPESQVFSFSITLFLHKRLMLHAQIKGRIARRIEERVRHLSTPLASFQKGGMWTPFIFNLGGGGRVMG